MILLHTYRLLFYILSNPGRFPGLSQGPNKSRGLHFRPPTWFTLYDIIFLINNKEVTVAWGEIKVVERRKEFVEIFKIGSLNFSD